MIEKWHHASYEIILVVVAPRNLRKRILLARNAAGPDHVLDIWDRDNWENANYTRLHNDIKGLFSSVQRKSCPRIVFPYFYSALNRHRVNAYKIEV